MDKSTQIIGIDIAKDKFDVWDKSQGHRCYENNPLGFKQFCSSLTEDSYCVMESTGSYYQQLAAYLYEEGICLSVVNPISVKRFIQMKLVRNKTDKSDARMLALYGQEQPLKPWIPAAEYIDQCKQLQGIISIYLKQSTALKNQLKSLESRGAVNKPVFSSLKRQLKQVQKEIDLLESLVETLIRTNDADLLVNIRSIPGIGKKTAALLIVLTNGFRDFDNYRQVSSFFGLAPTECSSGSCVRGSSRISKQGSRHMRNNLFLCSFTACMCNKQCNELYLRIVNKGKSKKLALIAVCNKLIKQSFSIAKSGIPYDPAYKSAMAGL